MCAAFSACKSILLIIIHYSGRNWELPLFLFVVCIYFSSSDFKSTSSLFSFDPLPFSSLFELFSISPLPPGGPAIAVVFSWLMRATENNNYTNKGYSFSYYYSYFLGEVGGWIFNAVRGCGVISQWFEHFCAIREAIVLNSQLCCLKFPLLCQPVPFFSFFLTGVLDWFNLMCLPSQAKPFLVIIVFTFYHLNKQRCMT